MKLLKITISIILLAAILTLPSCALFKGPVSDDDIKDIFREILPELAALNRCVWGDEAIPDGVSEDDQKSTVCLYKTVKSDFPYHNLDDFMAAVRKYYSADMLVIISEYAFTNSDSTMARFCNEVDDKSNIVDLRVDVTQNHPPFDLSGVAKIDTAKVKRSTTSIIDAEIEVFYAGGRTKTLTVNLLFEEDRWKINSYNWIAGVE